MSSNRSGARDPKHEAIRQSLTEYRRAQIAKDIRDFVIGRTLDPDDVTAVDMAFHVEKLPLMIEALKAVTAELEAMAKKDGGC